MSVQNFAARFELQVGYLFKDIEPDIARRIETFDALIAKHETFWVEILATLQPITIPYSEWTVSYLKQKPYVSVKVPVPNEVTTFLESRHPAWNRGDFLEAAFVAYLARIGGTGCFDIGFRDVDLQQELVGLEGFFASHVPCRVDIDYEQSFEEVFEAFRKQVELTKLHKTYARDVVARYPALHSLLELGHEEMFPVLLERVENLDTISVGAGNELTLVIPSDGKECCWLYNTEALDSDSIARMLEQFAIFLHAIVTDPTQPVAYLPLLSEQERHKIQVQWNDTQADYPQDKCIHQLFEAQVEQTPDAVAVVFEDQQLTYRELNCRANQLAHYLQKLGVAPDVLVGICVERSLDIVVGVLGILKAGGAYVPLDPTYPRKRLAFMLEDTQVPVLLTQQQLVEKLPEHNARLVCLDTGREIISQENEETPTSTSSPTNQAYVLYTSGSTGQPKGVAIEHHSTVAFLDWAREVFTSEQIAGVLASTSICFDISIFDLFVPLSWGGKVILAENALHLPTLPAAKDVTLISTVPSAITELLRINAIPNGVRTVTLAGEPLQNQLVQQLYQQETIQKVFNLYGLTEDTTYSTFVLVKKGASQRLTIGRPISNKQAYILDRHLQPVPIGVSGELYIGGVGLARCYLNRPELTEDKFIPNLFSEEPGARLYKTGDLARYLPDGNIEFLGRIDNQAKIRGFRIELGEIEAVLAQYPAVQETAVIAREYVPGDKHLVAYIVPHREQTPTTGELQRFLKQKLPDYMVPAAFVMLEALPLTPNGKIDRHALPVPNRTRQEPEKTFVAPSDELELRLTKIWENVLDIQPIGVRDNFFALGGHSLLAVRLFAAIKQEFGRNLPLATLFEKPTIEQLASMLRLSEQSVSWDSLVLIKSGGSKPPLFLVHDADGETILYRKLALSLESEQPVYGLRPYGQEEYPILHTRIADMAAHYIEKIRSIQPEGPYLLGGLCAGGILAFEIAVQLQAQEQKVVLVALIDAADVQTPINRHITHKRLRNFSQVVAQSQQLKGQERLTYILNKTKKKIKNLIAYESWTKIENIRDKCKVMLYRYYLDRRLPLPLFLQKIPVRTVLKFATQKYVPQVYQGRVTLFRATEAMIMDEPSIDDEPLVNITNDPLFGWGKRATDGVEVFDIPGGHSSMLQEPNVQVLAEKMQACINAALVVCQDGIDG